MSWYILLSSILNWCLYLAVLTSKCKEVLKLLRNKIVDEFGLIKVHGGSGSMKKVFKITLKFAIC